jgi:hypothetical protein
MLLSCGGQINHDNRDLQIYCNHNWTSLGTNVLSMHEIVVSSKYYFKY